MTGKPLSPCTVNNLIIGHRTKLYIRASLLCHRIASHGGSINAQPVYRDFRAGDVRQSQADVGKAKLFGAIPNT